MFCVLFFVLVQKVNACFCGTHYTGINNYSGSILTIPADTLNKGKFALGYSLNFQNYNSFSANTFRTILNKRVHSHSLDSVLTQSINLSYGLSDNLSLIANFPFKSYQGLSSTHSGLRFADGDSTGISDFSFFMKYRFLHEPSYSIALISGIKIPSGNTNQKNEIGELLSPDSQPGTGSWDPLVGLAVSKLFKDFVLHSSTLYQISTQGSQDIVVGDSLSANIGLSKKILKNKEFLKQNIGLDLVAEANFLWREKLEYQNLKDNNHGGAVIFLTPGLRLAVNDSFYNTFFLSFPIIQDFNGYQSDMALQLGFNSSFIF